MHLGVLQCTRNRYSGIISQGEKRKSTRRNQLGKLHARDIMLEIVGGMQDNNYTGTCRNNRTITLI